LVLTLVTVTNTNRYLILHLYISTPRNNQNQAFFPSGRLIGDSKMLIKFSPRQNYVSKGKKRSQSQKIFSLGGSAPQTPPPSSLHTQTKFRRGSARLTPKRGEILISARARFARARAGSFLTIFLRTFFNFEQKLRIYR